MLGALLLLLSKGWAVPVFLVSLLVMVGTAVYQYALTEGLRIMGTGGALFSAVIFVVCVLLFLRARAKRNRGVLA